MRHEGTGDAHRPDERTVGGRLVVETEPVPLVPDGVNAFAELAEARAGGARPPERRIVGRRRRIFGKRVEDVGQDQFLVLLLVMKPDLDEIDEPRERIRRNDAAIRFSMPRSTWAR